LVLVQIRKKKMIEGLEVANESDEPWETFWKAQNEVYDIMAEEPFRKFRRIILQSNLDQTGRIVRLSSGIFSIIAVLAIYLPLLFSHVDRYYRIFIFPCVWGAFVSFLQFKHSFCVVNGILGVQEKKMKRERLKDAFILQVHRIRAKKMLGAATLASIIVTVGLVAIPNFPMY